MKKLRTILTDKAEWDENGMLQCNECGNNRSNATRFDCGRIYVDFAIGDLVACFNCSTVLATLEEVPA